jgi:hypothetical protein
MVEWNCDRYRTSCPPSIFIQPLVIVFTFIEMIGGQTGIDHGPLCFANIVLCEIRVTYDADELFEALL